ncbi:hypothetical protein AB0939_09125 [Streptomyces sp. NPDC006990]|uniref:hypothetical protein n=1 Tax=unclassified Streptomyces TaxID=2593676 RepID=UPI003455C07A
MKGSCSRHEPAIHAMPSPAGRRRARNSSKAAACFESMEPWRPARALSSSHANSATERSSATTR